MYVKSINANLLTNVKPSSQKYKIFYCTEDGLKPRPLAAEITYGNYSLERLLLHWLNGLIGENDIRPHTAEDKNQSSNLVSTKKQSA